jgi:60 kDa SS-A/Ro ribonucleoprotein
MANKTIFNSYRGRQVTQTDTVNRAGGKAYALTSEQALAQCAITGCLTSTFYANADEQLHVVLKLANEVSTEYLAKLAVYAREQGLMKDMPALLAAVLSVRDSVWLELIFNRVMTNGRMVRNFVQIMRSGVVGRKSLGSLPKRLVKEWINDRGEAALFRDAVGNDPSIKDVIKMVRPKPANERREALYGYLIGKEVDTKALPQVVQDFELFKIDTTKAMPNVEFRLLTALDLKAEHWVEIARNASWQMTRMNLNTFARHGVFKVKGMDVVVANRLKNAQLIRKANVFPYQLMAAYIMADTGVPAKVVDALQDAMEVALTNVPKIEGEVYILLDTSGSMQMSVSGYRRGATSKVRCVDVAALFAAAITARNKQAEVLPFDTRVHQLRLNQRDSVFTNAAKLAKVGGGGTSCSVALRELNRRKAKVDMVVYVSDNESWVDANPGGRYRYNAGTDVMKEWEALKVRNPHAKMVCIDIVPNEYTQAVERGDILNIGGFSDQVFKVVQRFSNNEAADFVNTIEGVKL